MPSPNPEVPYPGSVSFGERYEIDTKALPTHEEMVEALIKIMGEPIKNHLLVLFAATRKAPDGDYETKFDRIVREVVEKILRERLPLTAPPDNLFP